MDETIEPKEKVPDAMSERDFMWFGIFERAYIKPIQMDGVTIFAVFAANGALLLGAPDSGSAKELVREELCMEPMSLH